MIAHVALNLSVFFLVFLLVLVAELAETTQEENEESFHVHQSSSRRGAGARPGNAADRLPRDSHQHYAQW